MSDQQVGSDPYSAVIADLTAKRDEIDRVIKSLEALRATGMTVAASSGSSSAVGSANGVVETAGMFLGMSIVDATKKLLAMRKRTMGNPEIVRDLKAGGMALNAKEPVNVVGSVLTRRFNEVGDVVKVGRGIWGLKEWYPGRSFKPNARSGDGEREAEPSPVVETEEEANQRVVDEIMAERVESGKSMF